MRSSWLASATNRRIRSSDASAASADSRRGSLGRLLGVERRLDLVEHRVERARRAGPPRCAGRRSGTRWVRSPAAIAAAVVLDLAAAAAGCGGPGRSRARRAGPARRPDDQLDASASRRARWPSMPARCPTATRDHEPSAQSQVDHPPVGRPVLGGDREGLAGRCRRLCWRQVGQVRRVASRPRWRPPTALGSPVASS